MHIITRQSKTSVCFSKVTINMITLLSVIIPYFRCCCLICSCCFVWRYPILAILFRHFGFIAPKTILGVQSFDFERTRWRLFQKRVVRTKFDIYVLFSRFRLCPVFSSSSVANCPGLSILTRLYLSGSL